MPNKGAFQLLIASISHWMGTIEWVSLHAICCYDISMDSVTLSIHIGVKSVRKHINSM